MTEKTCFVVMGFGKKPNLYAKPPRTLDLDKSYHHLIKPAVEACGIRCVRADEIKHSGVIDVPMYEQLLQADVVVADVSTSNVNAFYELGVRHALRPNTTIVVAEDELAYPFDVNHTAIRSYRHLGEDIGVGEAMRFQTELKEAIHEILEAQKTDSPVYTYLDLKPPEIRAEARDADAGPAKPLQAPEPEPENPTIAVLMTQVEQAKAKSDFATAASLLGALIALKKDDDYLAQQLALATYKSEVPTKVESLRKARGILEELRPSDSVDPETLGLWGAVHKRLWEETHEAQYLEDAVHAYERGFYIKNDYYNGINFAFMLNCRAAASQGDEAVADRVLAARTRRRVIEICGQVYETHRNAEPKPHDWYWILATLEEAWHALGDSAKEAEWRGRAEAAATEDWMRASTKSQLDKLDALL